jgi:hypothetical protein
VLAKEMVYWAQSTVVASSIRVKVSPGQTKENSFESYVFPGKRLAEGIPVLGSAHLARLIRLSDSV